MTEIPSDVMKAAYDAALDYRHDKACDPILFSMKIKRETVQAIVDAHNASIASN